MRTAEVPIAAQGLLLQFCESGMLRPVDFHLARRMAQLSRETDERVELAMALATRELRLGSVCLDITSAHTLLPDTGDDGTQVGGADSPAPPLDWPEPSEWLELLRNSPAVAGADGPDRPFRLVGALFYLDRFWAEERTVEACLLSRSSLSAMPVPREGLERALETDPPLAPTDPQRVAVEAALTNATTVITGGPGTGKTTTVARILRGLQDSEHPPLVALAAPTGKAATRLETSVRDALGDAGGLRVRSSTLHKLLDIVPGRERRTFGPENPLPHDVVIVDETSMVSLTMMSWLLEAVPESTRLVLIGDPDQLESVEVGAVLADIAGSEALVTSSSGSGVVALTHNWRSNEEINELSAAIRDGQSERALELLTEGETCSLIPYTGTEGFATFSELTADVLDCASAVQAAAVAGDGELANRELARHRILCAHREGPFGVSRWGSSARSWLSEQLTDYGLTAGPWAGQPLLITRSSDTVANGDTAVVTLRGGRLVACIDRARGPLWRDPAVLDGAVDLHAMTIHKSQGSQFGAVSVILPPVGSPLLTRQLVYTAVTRARRGVRIYGSPESLRQAIETPARRASGLGR
ncbi:exodeoxyribonuclease V subunit alpha [Tessaracoccus sp. OS52]|uniref:exodeoxyribonuclease V subunit alpha n=1 Tax=Tessaracoccus sp. OS52 TaxID=2886691 RepID=UPI001D0F7E16|nr:exodeoxyribonuclease V subunit alpha [Tessaracoccus sp. OS52]MCC2593109.1 exodeoxyribonuclease V subunit alpha [Tessaracoccus sp. OS52]